MLGTFEITGNTTPRTFNDMMDGRYIRSDVSYGQPQDFWTVKGAAPIKGNANTVSAAITRYVEKDVVIGGVTYRRALRIPLIFEVPVGFTSTDVDNVIADLNEFLTPAIVNTILLGVS